MANTQDGRKLTGLQELFLEHLFNNDEVNGDIKRAAEAAGVMDGPQMARGLKDEILARTDLAISMIAPKAVRGLADMLEHGDEHADGYQSHKADVRLKVIGDVLDRAGVAKKQDIGIVMTEDTPLFFIPAKQVQENAQTEA